MQNTARWRLFWDSNFPGVILLILLFRNRVRVHLGTIYAKGSSKRCSCPFGTIIWDVNLGRCHENLGWKFIIIYFFNWQTEKKPVLDQSEVCLPKYHNKFSWHRPKLTSQIIVPNGHEHLFCESHKTCSCPLVQYFGTLFWDDITIFWDEN